MTRRISIRRFIAPKALALALALPAVSLIACAGPGEAGEGDERVAAARQGLVEDGQVCVTIQRGSGGEVADATLWQAMPTWNEGAASQLSTGSTPLGGPRRSLLRFGLEGVPAGARVLSATVSLQQLYRNGGGTTVEVFPVTEAWDEHSVTWNSFGGAFEPVAAASFTTVASAPAVQTLDVSELSQAWVRGTRANQGILLAEDAASRTDYRSSDSVYAGERPRLEVCYVTCDDGLQNGEETGVDCGGPDCAPCNDMAPAWSQGFSPGPWYATGDVVADGQGNVVLAGWFLGDINLGGDTLTSGPYQRGFVAKFDGNGDHLWSRTVGGAGDLTELEEVAIDATGQVVVTGRFRGVLDLGGAPLAGYADAFVAKLDADGGHVWSWTPPVSDMSYLTEVTIDEAGNVLLAGTFEGVLDLGDGPRDAGDHRDIFVTKLDAGGAHVWSRTFGAAGITAANGVAIDASGNMLLSGHFEETLGFGGSALPCSSANVGAFVVQLGHGGDPIWSRCFDSTQGIVVTEVAAVGSSGWAIGGSYLGTTNLGDGPLTAPAGFDTFVIRLDTSGANVWSRGLAVAGDSQALSLAVDSAGHVIASGAFFETINLGAGPVSTPHTAAYLVKWTESGQLVWSEVYGGSEAAWPHPFSVGVNSAGSIFVAGRYEGPVDFGHGPLSGPSGLFLLKHAP